jgi:hypothetical protein
MRETQWIEWTRTRLQPQERQDSEGSAREISDHRFDYPASAACGSESLDNAVLRPDSGRPRGLRGAQKVEVA